MWQVWQESGDGWEPFLGPIQSSNFSWFINILIGCSKFSTNQNTLELVKWKLTIKFLLIKCSRDENHIWEVVSSSPDDTQIELFEFFSWKDHKWTKKVPEPFPDRIRTVGSFSKSYSATSFWVTTFNLIWRTQKAFWHLFTHFWCALRYLKVHNNGKYGFRVPIIVLFFHYFGSQKLTRMNWPLSR